MSDPELLRYCEFEPDGRRLILPEKQNRHRVRQRAEQWAAENPNYQGNRASAEDACKLVIETAIGLVVLEAVLTWIVQRVLDRWFEGQG